MIYLAILVVLIFISQLHISKLYYFVMLALFLFVAFRFDVGCDWQGYYHQFNTYGKFSMDEVLLEQEPLWVGAFVAQNALKLPYHWINIFAAVIFFAGTIQLAKSQPNRLLFIAVLYPVLILTIAMSGIRQASAIGIICFAFIYFNEKKRYHFIAAVFIASLFHSSAIIFLLLFPLISAEISRRTVILALLLAIPGAYAISQSSLLDVFLARYLDSDVEASGAIFRIALLFGTGVLFHLFLNKRWREMYPFDHKLASIGAVMMIGTPALLVLSSVIADRTAYYFIPIQAIILARVPYLQLGTNGRVIYAITVSVLIVFLTVWTQSSSLFELCYQPYDSWLFGLPRGG